MAWFQTNLWDPDQLLALVDWRKVILPKFQRSFVWRPADISQASPDPMPIPTS